ncbi:PRC and DUF2382 domain-containing protein [Amycolatopsis acidiphila]|uniref:DUF2382 domain-containing protein n=1 Tax=Amycolatopsis acidiphila TaxID=715473 RepID=A0A558AMN0_9PSEU|nr:PRC and DUF2382 domain-containing protein [Amycolatopsis acidiphila]TVT25526.1 DUF2382 domain-containing protein [Amycolatopsis acidiphila]UIJ60271.1 PRC and DUF2382 domain-containing protein [Amycolatopsis acidiphila]GHG60375.1 hypothetical protein GCM10017788_14070 [Amycolatopsis acidiphila]
MTSTLRPEELTENAVVDPQGKKIGKVGTVYLSDDTQQPEWVTVRTGMFGQKESFVPLRGARLDRDGLHVQVSKDQVTDAPRTDADQHLSEQESVELYRYYKLPTPRSSMENRTAGSRGRMEGARGRGEAGEAMTRSEEQLKVGKEQVETGRVRLRKYTVTEEQQIRVPVTHEEVRVEREPITDGERGNARIGDEEQEMTLHAERARVEKEAVPMEKVRLRKEDVTEEQSLSGEVRKEQIEVEDGRDKRDRRNHP